MKNRRDFIKSVAAAGAASSVATPAFAQSNPAAPAADTASSALPPSSQAQIMEDGGLSEYTAEEADRYFIEQAGSDFMVDIVKKLGIDFMAANPGSSFRGFQESVVAYGGNKAPEWLTCMHEESSVAMAHGYAKIAYKPMGVVCHGTVGLQHAAMAIYNAWCDRAPLVIFAGNHLDATERRLGTEWAHSVQDAAKLVRDFVKWDDMPVSLPHFAESTVRAYKIAMTPPMGPVVITMDGHLQEKNIAGHSYTIPELSPTIPPQGDSGALREAAQLLANAERPVIVVDYAARTPAGVQRLVDLAESLQAPVVDRAGRMNFPNQHYLHQTGKGAQLIQQADVVLGLEVLDFFAEIHRIRDSTHRVTERRAKPDVKLISLGVNDLFYRSNYQNFQRYQPVDLSIAGDAEATMPDLTEQIKRVMGSGRRGMLRDRAEAFRKAHHQTREQTRQAAVNGWNMSPISLPRMYMELWDQIKDHDWSMLSRPERWTRDLWNIDKHYQHIGYSGGRGIGYVAPAATGAALANREHGRLSVNIQPDGDLMYAPGILWTSAHHHIPLLSIMHNNRAYQRENMHLQRMASRRRRNMDGSTARIGNVIDNPEIDYASMAKSMGLWSSGPITDPADLAPAIKKAIDVVTQGEPALIDVVCQPR